VEDEISKAIADKLQVQLAEGSEATLVAQKTIDPRAHDFYLRGLPLIAARGRGGFPASSRDRSRLRASVGGAGRSAIAAAALLPRTAGNCRAGRCGRRQARAGD